MLQALSLKEIFSTFLVMFAIIDITGSIPIFLSLKQSGNKYHPLYAALISLGIFVVFFFMRKPYVRNSFMIAKSMHFKKQQEIVQYIACCFTWTFAVSNRFEFL